MGIERRKLVIGALALPALAACSAHHKSRFAELEQAHGARLGVWAVDNVSGQSVRYRSDERFAMCSTFKGYATAALLKAHPLSTGYFDQAIRYAQSDVVTGSPVTSTHVATGMTLRDIAQAAITRSDNTAGNLLLRQLGGPSAVTAFARSIGDPVTRLDRWETELNDADRGDLRDTTTPAALGGGYRASVLGDVLATPERTQLTDWLRSTVTGAHRIRAGLPPGWVTADKTGTGRYATANDVAITWPDPGHPLVIAILTDKSTPDATVDEALLADAARAVVQALR
jgi:beta-lactamase class A